jgi:hypothetical protein
MIETVLDVIKNEIDTFMKLKMKDTREQYIHLAPVIDQEGKSSTNENTICMSLVKIEEDKINTPVGVPIEPKPPVKLDLYILFSASCSDGQEKNYKEALKRISLVIAFFQAKSTFTSANTPLLDPGVGRISAELLNMGLEEQNNLWSMLGGMYRPSVMYIFRALMIREIQPGDSEGLVLEKNMELGEKNEL